MKYLAFLNGKYSTAPGLVPNHKAEGADRLVFQIDDTYRDYLQNKNACRQENIHKYYLKHEYLPETAAAVNRYIATNLLDEQTDLFEGHVGKSVSLYNRITKETLQSTDGLNVASGKYLDLFDALCCQVQEDVAVVQLVSGTDYISAIHLCSPNHWSPAQKIGKFFRDVHIPVPAMERTLQNYYRMLESIVASPAAATRLAWGIATDTRLNHHPEPPSGVDVNVWRGRLHDTHSTWYVRSERQVLIGLPAVNAFVFTIRTYHYAVDELSPFEKEQLLAALRSMSTETLQYKGLSHALPLLEQALKPVC